MRVLSVCSGIGSDAVAWHPLGWQTVAFAEVDPQASSVLKHHFTDVPNVGDFTRLRGDEYGPVGLVVGGTPCQSFSVAGLRKGLDDDRGNLALQFCKLVGQARPEWVVWENVLGVLAPGAENEEPPFISIVRALDAVGYGVCWRVLDAQYVRVESHPRAVPQQRKRVFLVGYRGDWRPAAAVLLDPEGLCRNTPPRRETRNKTLSADHESLEIKGVAGPVTAKWSKGSGGPSGDECYNLIVAPYSRTLCAQRSIEVRGDPDTSCSNKHKVRRLTPLECERLMGLPDGYTEILHGSRVLSDNARYKLLGNGIAINCLSWIGRRIDLFGQLVKQ